MSGRAGKTPDSGPDGWRSRCSTVDGADGLLRGRIRAGRLGGLILAGCAWSGCLRDPDPGGQEGEERWPDLAGESDGGGENEDTEDADATDIPEAESAVGERHHLRGDGPRGDYVCSLVWLAEGTAVEDLCPDCSLGFSMVYTLDPEASDRNEGACGDVYADASGDVGFIADYSGLGPMAVGIDPDSGEAYPLGPATLDGAQLSWSYGYIDEAWTDAAVYGTWYWRVRLDLR